jgi:hypothetical protein
VDVLDKPPMHAICAPQNMARADGHAHNILWHTSDAPGRLLSKPHFRDGNYLIFWRFEALIFKIFFENRAMALGKNSYLEAPIDRGMNGVSFGEERAVVSPDAVVKAKAGIFYILCRGLHIDGVIVSSRELEAAPALDHGHEQAVFFLYALVWIPFSAHKIASGELHINIVDTVMYHPHLVYFVVPHLRSKDMLCHRSASFRYPPSAIL